MENIAIFSSGDAKASREITTLFNEGNRFRVTLLVTDNADAPTAEFMREKGIDVLTVSSDKLKDEPLYVADVLRKHGISYIVVEQFTGHLDPALIRAVPNEPVYADATDDLPRHFSDLYVKNNLEHPRNVRENDRQWAQAFSMRCPGPPAVPMPPAAPQIPPAPLPGAPKSAQAAPPAQAAPAADCGPQPQGEERPPMPSTYLIWSIIALLLCCIPGIIALVFSSQVSSKYFQGDYEGARKSSEYAQICIIAAIVLGVVANTIAIPLML